MLRNILRWSPSFIATAILMLATTSSRLPTLLGQDTDPSASPPADNRPSGTVAEASSNPSPTPQAESAKSSESAPKGAINVTATRWEAADVTIPRMTAQIEGKDAHQRLLGPDLPTLLGETAGVQVQKTGRWMGSPFIRGLTGYYNLVLIDGIRYNNSIFRSGPNQYWALIDPLMVDRLELVFGGASTLYGSDAVTGTINVLTERWKPGTAAGYTSRLYARAGSGERSMIGRVAGTASFGPDQGGFTWGLSGKGFGEIVQGGGKGQPYTGYDQYDANFRLTLVLEPGLEFDFLAQFTQLLDAPRTHSTNQAVSFNGSTVGTDQQREFDHDRALVAAILSHSGGTGFIQRAKLSLSYQRMTQFEFRRRANNASDLDWFDCDTLGFSAQFGSTLDNHHLTFGFDGYADRVRSKGIDRNASGVQTAVAIQGPVGDDSWYLTGGLFLTDEWRLNDQWTLTFGGRGTIIHARSDRVLDPVTPGNTIRVDEVFYGGASSVSLAFFFVPDAQAYIAFHQSFRAPTLSDLTAFDAVRSQDQLVPSPGLDPEYFYTFEIGAKALTTDFNLKFSAYFMLLNNVIVIEPTGNMISGRNEVKSRNGGNGYITGAELNARCRITEHLFLFGAFAVLKGEVDRYATASTGQRERQPLSRAIPFSGSGGVRLEVAHDKNGEATAWVELYTVFALRQAAKPDNDQGDTQRIPPRGNPAWATLNLRGAWQVSPSTTVFLKFENLTDELYRVIGSGSNEPGFNLVGGVDIRW